MKHKVKITIAVIIGFAAATLLMGIAIYFGYNNAYAMEVGEYTVQMFGLSIYQLTKIDTKYSGISIGQNMGIICGIFMTLSVVIEEILHKLNKR